MPEQDLHKIHVQPFSYMQLTTDHRLHTTKSFWNQFVQKPTFQSTLFGCSFYLLKSCASDWALQLLHGSHKVISPTRSF